MTGLYNPGRLSHVQWPIRYFSRGQVQTQPKAHTITMDQKPLRPPIRWAGGKRSIANSLKALMPKDYDRYVEPMAGSAALFFAVGPKKAILSDLNYDLVNYYCALRDSHEVLIPALMEMSASRETYYSLRSSSPATSMDQALRFAYLNRLCWNGVYRVNRLGSFNVPIGSRLPQILWDANHLLRCSERLRSAQIRVQDVFDSVTKTRKGDFLFLDPPYPKGAPGVGFNRYTSSKFSLADHKRLGCAVKEASSRGVKVMVVLSKQLQFLDLYQEGFQKYNLPTKTLIACNGESRKSWSECVLRNYFEGEDA